MAPMARRTSALAGAAAASVLAAQTFVLAPGGTVAPRAAGSAASPASSWPATPGFGGATALAALGAAGVSLATGRRAVRMSAAKEEKVAAKEEAPPPPPPFDPSKQVGALAPLGFFDPLGFCKTGDEAGFRNLRAAELKHARVAMMASLGAVVQPAVKFPGFDDVPAGIGALTTVQGGIGFVVLFGLSGFLETQVWTEDPKKEPGNFGDPAGLGMYDVDMRNKELNNGRLAMFTAMGLILAELVSGKSGFGQFS